MKINKQILIIANGQLPESEKIEAILESNPFIICCDGSADKLEAMGLKPDLIIGDIDSLSESLQKKYKTITTVIDSQDTNDLQKALSWLDSRDIESVTIIGADGKREDHSLCNILLLLENHYQCKIFMITSFGRFDVMNTRLINSDEGQYSQTFDSFTGQPVSLFCLDRDVKLQSQGLKYPLVDFSFKMLYDASLNIATHDSFIISCDIDNVNILVYRADEEA